MTHEHTRLQKLKQLLEVSDALITILFPIVPRLSPLIHIRAYPHDVS